MVRVVVAWAIVVAAALAVGACSAGNPYASPYDSPYGGNGRVPGWGAAATCPSC